MPSEGISSSLSMCVYNSCASARVCVCVGV